MITKIPSENRGSPNRSARHKERKRPTCVPVAAQHALAPEVDHIPLLYPLFAALRQGPPPQRGLGSGRLCVLGAYNGHKNDESTSSAHLIMRKRVVVEPPTTTTATENPPACLRIALGGQEKSVHGDAPVELDLRRVALLLDLVHQKFDQSASRQPVGGLLTVDVWLWRWRCEKEGDHHTM